jgi:hypothetical protein
VRATNEGDDLNATGFFKAVLPVDPGAALREATCSPRSARASNS